MRVAPAVSQTVCAKATAAARATTRKRKTAFKVDEGLAATRARESENTLKNVSARDACRSVGGAGFRRAFTLVLEPRLEVTL